MEYLVIDHLRFPIADSRHNPLHWLIVVLIRIIISIFLIPLSFYLFTLGFLLSAETIQPYSPPIWFEKVSLYITKLPYFQELKNLVFFKLGPWYQDVPVWWTMVVGLPLIVLSVCLFLIVFFNLYYSIFSPTYNQTHCPLCRQSNKSD